MKSAIVLLILGLAAPFVAGAQDLPSLEQMRQTAARGNDAAQLEMGILYEFGYNMPKNDINALAWYQLSADQGNALAVKRRDLLKSQLKPEEVEAAMQLSRQLLEQTPAPVVEAAPAPAEPVAPAAEPAAPAEAPPAAPPSAQ